MNSCDNDQDLIFLNITRKTYSSAPFTVAASCLSIFGSFTIIFSYLAWKDVRQSTARTIVFYLALADLGTSLSYLFSAIVYLAVFNDTLVTSMNGSETISRWNSRADQYKVFCKIESIVDTYFQNTSFFWTMNLAIFFVMTLVCNRCYSSKRILIPFNLTAWGIPAILCVVGAATHWLAIELPKRQIEGIPAGSWCFVGNQLTEIKRSNSSKMYLYYGMEAVFGKGWEIISYFVVLACYTLVIGYNKCRFCPVDCCYDNKALDLKNFNPFRIRREDIGKAIAALDVKLLLIPIAFIIVRLPGTLRYIVSFAHPGCHITVYNRTDDSICINNSCIQVLYNQVLINLQAIGDPLQGFLNGIIFVFLSKMILTHFYRCLNCCCRNKNYARIKSRINDKTLSDRP